MIDSKEMLKKNNRGISLVELIVTIAIATIVGGAVLGLIVTSYNQYHNQNANINLQYEAQLAMNQVEDLIINATNGVDFDDTTSTLTVYNQMEDNSGGTPVIKNLVTTVRLNSAKNQLVLSKYIYGVDETDGVVKRNAVLEDQLMADYVSAFSVDLSELETKKLLGVSMEFDFDSKSYDTTNSLKLRNNIGRATDNTAFNSGHVLLNSVATEIQVAPDSMTVARGTTAPSGFSTHVVGTNFPLQDVTWTIASTVSDIDNTVVDSSDGKITIGPNETSSTITLRATSAALGGDGNPIHKDVTIYNKYASGIGVAVNNKNDAERTATLNVSLNGYNFESGDEANYMSGISLAFYDGEIDVTDSFERPLNGDAYSTTVLSYVYNIHLNNKDLLGKDISIKARYVNGSSVFESSVVTINFPTVTIKDAQIALFDNNSEVEKTGGNYILERGKSYTVKLRVKDENGNTALWDSGNEYWSFFDWDAPKYNNTNQVADTLTFNAGTGTLTVSSNLGWASSYSYKISTSSETFKDLGTITQGLKVQEVKLVINECQKAPDQKAYPVKVQTWQTLHFTLSGVGNSSEYSIFWLHDEALQHSASGMSVTFYKLYSGTRTFDFGVKDKYGNELKGLTASITIVFGSPNVYQKTNNGNIQLINNSPFLFTNSECGYYVSTGSGYYLLDGTFVGLHREGESEMGTSTYQTTTVTYNGVDYAWRKFGNFGSCWVNGEFGNPNPGDKPPGGKP